MNAWSTSPLGELCKLVNGRAFKPTDWTKTGLPIVRIQNLNNSTKRFNRYSHPVDPKHKVDTGNVLLAWSGTPSTSFGCFVWDRGAAILNQHIFRVHVNSERMLGEFFVYAVNSRLDEMIRLAHGGVGLRHITKRKLEAIELPIPPMNEQRRIVTILDGCMERIGEIRRLREGGIRESKVIESSIFHDFLHDGRGDPRWPLVRLGDLTKSSRYGTSMRAQLQPTGVPVLRMGNIVGGYLNLLDLKYVELPEEQKRKYLLSPGDVLINRTNSLELVGKAATFDQQDEEWVYASYLVRIQVDTRRVLPEFVTATINGRIGRKYVLNTARRAIGMVNINAKEMAGFPISLPPLDVQRELVDRLAEVRRVSQQIRSGLGATDADHLSSAVLRKAFAGEL